MITPGQTLENPVTGERFTFIETAATTGGELLASSSGCAPAAPSRSRTCTRSRPSASRSSKAACASALGLRTVVAGPGDVVEVAPGVVHGFANAGDGDARVRVEVRPALAMEAMFAEVVAMAHAGRLTRRGMPRNLLDLALLARTYDQEAHAPFLSVGLQRAAARAARPPRARRGEGGRAADLDP